MDTSIALAGNPNCGKTTLFNALTGSSQYVGNWPGVTVEKKEGKLKEHRDVTIQDLPGIYSLSPYTLEEVVARGYLVNQRPDAILNIVDGTNLERNLYLTTQLLELGLPVVVAVNMIDLVRKNGDTIDLGKLGGALGCAVVEMSALKGEGGTAAAERAVALARQEQAWEPPHIFTGAVERTLSEIEGVIQGNVPAACLRWYAVKVFERDKTALAELKLPSELTDRLEQYISACEQELDDDAESIITSQRYDFIRDVVSGAVKRNAPGRRRSVSDAIDQVVTNRVLALPIFVAVMFLVYALSMGGWRISIGSAATDWANDGLFGDGWFLPFSGSDVAGYEEAAGDFAAASAILAAHAAGASEAYLYDAEAGEETALPVNETSHAWARLVEEPNPAEYGVWVPGLPVLAGQALEAMGVHAVLSSLILDGILAGVGAVLGFLPQMLVLFLLLAILEDVGYMARIAFIMDRIFRRFGLSGKSFIPMLVATGCGVPGIMASRTIEQERDRKMTVMTTGFIPCGAKMPIIALFAGALFGGSPLVAASAYFTGVGAVVISGIILKKFRAFAGEPAPFVMELPAYHIPSVRNVLRSVWERGWSFIQRAGTIILLSTIVLWFLSSFGFTGGVFGWVEDSNSSLLAAVGGVIAVLFVPLGFGTWQAAVATITGLIAKEEVVSTMQVFYPGDLTANIASAFTALSAYSFMVFNLLCAPCFAAIGAIRREMNSPKWTWAAIGYMCGFAYGIALMVYQLGGLLTGTATFSLWTVLAAGVLVTLLYLLVRRGHPAEAQARRLTSMAAVSE